MKITKKILAALIAVVVLASALSLTCVADGRSTISCKTTATVGETITVTLRISPDAKDNEIIGVEGNFTYDADKLSYVDNDTAKNDSGGSVRFALVNSSSTTFMFKVVSAGKCVVGANNITYSGGADNSQYNVTGSSVSINITDAAAEQEVKTIAALSSLRLSGTELSPAFSKNTTSYSAQVSNTVEKINVSATPAAGCKVTGTGEVKLDYGENKHTVTVTADDGSKKVYTITIKRLTAEEAAALEAEKNVENPLAVKVGEKDLTIVKDISEITVPKGFEQISLDFKEEQIGVITDESYTLYYLHDATQNTTNLYTYDSEKDEFSALTYVLLDDRLYIWEPEIEDAIAPQGYYSDIFALTAGSAPVYRSENQKMADFCWLNVYYDGETGYYRYDTKQGVLQRSPDFVIAIATDVVAEPDGFSLSTLMNISLVGKIILALMLIAIIVVVVLVVLLIVKLTNRDDDDSIVFDTMGEEMEFVSSEEIDLSRISEDDF